MTSSILTSWDASKRKDSTAARFDLPWDECAYQEIRLKLLLSKRRLIILRNKVVTEETSISLKPIFNLASKSIPFQKKMLSLAFEKHSPTHHAPKGLPSLE